MQLLQELLALQLVGWVFGEALLADLQHRPVERRPVELVNQFLDVGHVELGFAHHRLLDVDGEREAVLLAFGHVADQKVVCEQSHGC